MVHVAVAATYRPTWRDNAGRPVAGPDEDATTMAVATASLIVDSPAVAGQLQRVVVVTRTPALLEGPTPAVIATALGLPDRVPIELHLGGGPAVLDVVTTATPGTLVIGVDPEPPAAGAGALVSRSGAAIDRRDRIDGRLPARVRAPGERARVCDDPRLLRDFGWQTALAHAGELDARTAVVVGGGPRRGSVARSTGASAPLLALSELASNGTVVALEADTMTSVEVTDVQSLRVIRDESPPQASPTGQAPEGIDSSIPASAAAYARAFEAKVGFKAGRCECGALDLPPRYRCLSCGRADAWSLECLPRTGTVYSTVTIHATVPGRRTPYSLAVIDVDEVGIRHLAPVTDVPAGAASIGDRGRFVLRRLADREVGPDYGWAFAPVRPAPIEVPA